MVLDPRDLHFSILFSAERHLARIVHPLHTITDFCKLIRRTNEGVKRCENSDKTAFRVACEKKKPYIYECHAGLVDGVIPVLLGDNPVTFVMFGQFLFEPPNEEKFNEVWRKVEDLKIPYDELREAYFSLPVFPREYVWCMAEGFFEILREISLQIMNLLFPQEKEREGVTEVEQWFTQQERQMLHFLNQERDLLSLFHWASGGTVKENLEKVLINEIEQGEGVFWERRSRVWGLITTLLSHLRRFRASSQIDFLELTYQYVTMLRYCENIEEFKEILTRIVNDLVAIRGELSYKTSIVERVKEYISRNLKKEGLCLREVAKRMRFSPYYLAHLFKSVEGISIGRYIRNTRIARAKELLRSTGLPVGRIAEEVGFKDTTHFCHVFKRATGMSPSQYRSKT